MTPITFPSENPLYPGAFRDFGLMAWVESSTLPKSSSSSADRLRPDAIWLEATHPSSGRPQSIHLALSRQGVVIGDLRWSNRTPSILENANSENVVSQDPEIVIRGPVFGGNAMSATSTTSTLPATDKAELLERTFNMAQSLVTRMQCVLCLDAVSLSEVRRFAKTEGAAFSQADQIAKHQAALFKNTEAGGPGLYDYGSLVRTAKAYAVAKGEGAVDEMVRAQQGGWARRLAGNLRGI